MNKNISVWRGFGEPPTKYHLWIDEKNNVNLWDGTDWKTIADGKNYADIVEHLESFPKIDIVNEIPNGSDFKNGDFQLYELGKDITISSPECYEFGKNTSFTIREGDLCLIGKIKHAPTSLEAERPKFSDKYKYKIRFDANLNYYFGGTGNVGDPVLTTTTQPLTYSLIGSEDKFIIKCGNYYAFISGERLSLTNQLSNATHFVLHELESNKFELLNYNSQSLGLNAHQGLGTDGDYSDEIHWYDAGRPGNIVQFLPQENELIIKKVISTQEATTSYSGLMSKEDKVKLNSIASNANNYSLPTASSLTKGGIKIGYSQTANNRAVQLSSDRAYVNIPDATTSQAGLMSSSDKNKLDNSSAYKHVFTGLSALASSGDGWYHIIDLGDTEAAIVQISTGGHSDVQLAISSGWGGDDSFSLNILNSLLRGNPNYAYVKAIRVRKQKNGDSGYLRLEAKLNRTDYTDAKYRTTVVSVLTNANHNPIVTSDTSDKKHLLQLVTTTSETLLQEINLVDQAMIVKNIVADNLATVATSGSYNDLKNRPSIPNETTETKVANWGFTKNTGTITGITMNGVSKGTSGTVDLGTVNTITKITWNASSNMNDFKTPGVYEIYGERTVKTDNLPITNEGGGNSISAILTVVASTLQPANNEICITQFLQLSNRIGGEGTTYVRTYNENNNGMNGWLPWQKQMGVVETLINSDYETVGPEIFTGTAEKIGQGLSGMIDNGMYSGMYLDNISYAGSGNLYYLSAQPTFVETFVLIVINDYAATGKLGMQRHITQLKYAVDAITGQSTVKKRVGTDNNGISWGNWEDIGGGNTYLNPNDYMEFNYLSKLGVGTFEFSGTLLHDDFPDSIWRYIWDLGIRNNQFTMKVVIDSSTTATATIMGCGKYDIVTFNPSNNSDVVSILNGSIINALNTEV